MELTLERRIEQLKKRLPDIENKITSACDFAVPTKTQRGSWLE